MNRFANFALALVALGLTTASAERPVADSERIVVLGAPSDFQASAANLGFTKIEAFAFEAVGVDGFRILVPANESAPAIKLLRERFPAAAIDTETTSDFAIAF